MRDLPGYASIDSDDWRDAGQIYKILAYHRRPDSTAVELTIEHSGGQKEVRVVAYHLIEWIDGD